MRGGLVRSGICCAQKLSEAAFPHDKCSTRRYDVDMGTLDRITFNPEIMGGKPCIRGMRVTVGMIVGLIASGRAQEEILRLYPYLEHPDIEQALAYAAWRVEEIEVPLAIA